MAARRVGRIMYSIADALLIDEYRNIHVHVLLSEGRDLRPGLSGNETKSLEVGG